MSGAAWRSDINVAGTDKIRRMLQLLGAEAGARSLAAAAEDVEDYVGKEAGTHTKGGALSRSVYMRRVGDAWEVGNDLRIAPHAVFVHWGSKAHVIKPKRPDGFVSTVKAHSRNGRPVKEHTRTGKAMLRWGGPNGLIYARAVKHPGYAGDAWMVRAAQQAPQLFEQHLAATLKRIGAAD